MSNSEREELLHPVALEIWEHYFGRHAFTFPTGSGGGPIIGREFCKTVGAIIDTYVESQKREAEIKGGMREIAGIMSRNMDIAESVNTNASTRVMTIQERYSELQSTQQQGGEL